jgi:hypothetical protein
MQCITSVCFAFNFISLKITSFKWDLQDQNCFQREVLLKISYCVLLTVHVGMLLDQLPVHEFMA